MEALDFQSRGAGLQARGIRAHKKIGPSSLARKPSFFSFSTDDQRVNVICTYRTSFYEGALPFAVCAKGGLFFFFGL